MNRLTLGILIFVSLFFATSEKHLFSAELTTALQPTTPSYTPQQTTETTSSAQSLVDSKNDLMELSAITATATTATNNLTSYLRTNSDARYNVNLLYGTSIQTNDVLSSYEQATLAQITSKSGYGQSAYLYSLSKTSSLYKALQANTTQRRAYNTKYKTYLQSSGAPMAADRTKLFGSTAPSSYTQSAFLSSLSWTSTPTTTPSTLPPGALFGTGSFWNTKISSSVKSNSAALVTELVRQTKLATPWLNTVKYSTPLYVVSSATAKVPVAIVSNGKTMTSTKLHVESMKGVPIPANAVAAGGTDGHITIWDTSTNKLYEYWQLRKNSYGKWQASWGGIISNASTSSGVMPIVKNAAGGNEWWGATGSGLAAIGGTILVKELKAGKIPHALAMAIPYAKNTFVSPANRSDGSSTAWNAIPEGSRFKLPASTYIDPSWPPIMKMMVIAARDYGIVVRDKAGAVTFYGEDPKQYGTNPYPTYYGGLPLNEVMAKFPFSKLRVVS